MSQEQSPTKDQNASDSQELSIEDLEKVIAENDPEFLEGLKEIGPIEANVFDDAGISMAPTYVEFKEKWKDSKLKYLVIFLYPAVVFKYKLIQWKVKIRTEFFPKLKQLGPELLTYAKKSLIRSRDKYHRLYIAYRRFDQRKSIIFHLAVAGTALVPYLIYKSYTTGLIPKQPDLFMRSMEDLAFKKYTYSENEMESFYESPRVPQNILNLKKMVVNIKASESSGQNPMLAAEFYLEGISSDVLVEIKDREYEFIDLFQRTIEEHDFDFLESQEGKKELVRELLMLVNKHTTTGKIKKIYIKNFVLKP